MQKKHDMNPSIINVNQNSSSSVLAPKKSIVALQVELDIQSALIGCLIEHLVGADRQSLLDLAQSIDDAAGRLAGPVRSALIDYAGGLRSHAVQS